MNTDIIKGNWKQLKGKVKEKWGRLTNDDLDVINGEYEQLVGKIQELYGREREEVEEEVKRFERSCADACAQPCSRL